jgi:hypothetical protein
MNFENSWEKGKTYFLNHKKCNQILHFSEVFEATIEKHPQFAEAIDGRDAEIFLQIPSLLILKSLEDDDKNLCKSFYGIMLNDTSEAGKKYATLK